MLGNTNSGDRVLGNQKKWVCHWRQTFEYKRHSRARAMAMLAHSQSAATVRRLLDAAATETVAGGGAAAREVATRAIVGVVASLSTKEVGSVNAHAPQDRRRFTLGLGTGRRS
jgi:hypothetical protein